MLRTYQGVDILISRFWCDSRVKIVLHRVCGTLWDFSTRDLNPSFYGLCHKLHDLFISIDRCIYKKTIISTSKAYLIIFDRFLSVEQTIWHPWCLNAALCFFFSILLMFCLLPIVVVLTLQKNLFIYIELDCVKVTICLTVCFAIK
jgi:hypothetical protein